MSWWTRAVSTAAMFGVLVATSCSSPPDSTELGVSEIVVSRPPAGPQPLGGCGSSQESELTIGAIFPEGGALGAPARMTAAKIAVDAIDDSGGVFGVPIRYLEETATSATLDDVVDRLVNTDSDALLTVVGSADGLAILDRIGELGLVQISPNQTAVALEQNDRYGVYFRTAPSDFIQARVLADELKSHSDVVVLYRDDTYGNGLFRAFRNNFEFGTKRVRGLAFSDANDDFQALGGTFLENDEKPEALIIVGYNEETKEILEALGPAPGFDIWGVDGNTNVFPLLDQDQQLMDGFRQTVPWPSTSDSRVDNFYNQVLAEAGDNQSPLAFTAETHDAVVIVALAAVAAGCDDSRRIAKEINDVTRDGTKCFDFAGCKELLEADQDIDFDGVGGIYDFLDEGEPSIGRYRIDTYDANGLDSSKTKYEAREYCLICRLNEPGIFFEHASFELGTAERHRLAEVAETIKERPEMGDIQIQGFASRDGTAEFNLQLSKDRANQVRSHLVDQGVDPERLTIKGFGATEQRAQDRVVLFAEPSAAE